MGKRNRVCLLCGTKYEYCPTCTQDKTKPAFMAEFHSESCKNIFEICTRFNMGLMSKVEAQEALASCDLSHRANFKPFVQRDLDKIFAEEPKIKRGKRAAIKPIDDASGVEPEIIKPIINDIHEVVKTEE